MPAAALVRRTPRPRRPDSMHPGRNLRRRTTLLYPDSKYYGGTLLGWWVADDLRASVAPGGEVYGASKRWYSRTNPSYYLEGTDASYKWTLTHSGVAGRACLSSSGEARLTLTPGPLSLNASSSWLLLFLFRQTALGGTGSMGCKDAAGTNTIVLPGWSLSTRSVGGVSVYAGSQGSLVFTFTDASTRSYSFFKRDATYCYYPLFPATGASADLIPLILSGVGYSATSGKVYSIHGWPHQNEARYDKTAAEYLMTWPSGKTLSVAKISSQGNSLQLYEVLYFSPPPTMPVAYSSHPTLPVNLRLASLWWDYVVPKYKQKPSSAPRTFWFHPQFKWLRSGESRALQAGVQLPHTFEAFASRGVTVVGTPPRLETLSPAGVHYDIFERSGYAVDTEVNGLASQGWRMGTYVAGGS